jgi:hypothetical protein
MNLKTDFKLLEEIEVLENDIKRLLKDLKMQIKNVSRVKNSRICVLDF